MKGQIVLIGGEEFDPSFDDVHSEIMSLLQFPKPRIVFFPTAAAKDGPGVAEHWAGVAKERLSHIGAVVTPLMILDSKSANDEYFVNEIEKADIIYLGGGLPQVYLEILSGSKTWKTIASCFSMGKPIIGASAGAMILGEICLVNENENDYPPSKWAQGYGILQEVGIGPHFNAFNKTWKEKIEQTLPKGKTLLGIDESTAFLIKDDKEYILGKGKVIKIKRG